MLDGGNARDAYYAGLVGDQQQELLKAKTDSLMGRYKALKNTPSVQITVETILPIGDPDEADVISTLPHISGGSSKLTARGRTMAEAIEIIFGMLAMIEPLNYDDADADEQEPTEESPE